MDSLEQSGGRIASAIVKLGGQGQAPSPFRLGQVLEAGHGRLRVSCGGLLLEREALYLAAGLDFNWTEDTGGPELLRSGDTVALLSADDQTYYLVARMVSP